MTKIGQQNIINWIEGCDMFDKYARDYVVNLIIKDIKNDQEECQREK